MYVTMEPYPISIHVSIYIYEYEYEPIHASMYLHFSVSKYYLYICVSNYISVNLWVYGFVSLS